MRGRAQRLGQVQHRGCHRLGHGRAGGEVASRRGDVRRHLRGYQWSRTPGSRRGRPHDRQHRRRASHRLHRGHHLAHSLPQRRIRVRHQWHPVPTPRHPRAPVGFRHRSRDARHRGAGAARCDPARDPRGPSWIHRGGRGRPQAPQAQGEGPPQARCHAGQPHAGHGSHDRAPTSAEAPGAPGRGRPTCGGDPGRGP